jgi:hypothetical protein
VAAAFAALVDVHQVASLPGSVNAAYYSIDTTLVVEAVPEPSSFALMLSSFGLLALWSLRKRSC